MNSRSGTVKQSNSIEDIENSNWPLKEQIFGLSHFDSPHFIDCQNAYDVMEINYLRLKQRFIHTPEKALETARDWHRYAEALRDIRSARLLLDCDWSGDAGDNFDEKMTEPLITKEEIEKKFKLLLEKDWQKLPLDYFQRMETMKKPDKKTSAKFIDDVLNELKYYYGYNKNVMRLIRLRREQKEQKEKEEQEKT